MRNAHTAIGGVDTNHLKRPTYEEESVPSFTSANNLAHPSPHQANARQGCRLIATDIQIYPCPSAAEVNRRPAQLLRLTGLF